MNAYKLIFVQPGSAQSVIEFQAADAGHALAIARGEAGDWPAELWNKDLKVCEIRRTRVADDCYFAILPAGRDAAGS